MIETASLRVVGGLLVVSVMLGVSALLGACASSGFAASEHESAPDREVAGSATGTSPLCITGGETFTIESKILGETRRINVLVPTVYGQKIDEAMPVLYMPDGGMDEDFLHIAGLVQVLVSNGGMRPHVLVGIENTQRRRDMTGPTESAEDRKIAPVVGRSAAFRRFMKEELMPAVRARYRTADEAAIMGESLAGLFAVECFLYEPSMFRACIAIDPSLWCNGEGLVREGAARVAAAGAVGARTLYIAYSNEPTIAEPAERFAGAVAGSDRFGVRFTCIQLPEETHATIYHPAAIRALRAALGPLEGAR